MTKHESSTTTTQLELVQSHTMHKKDVTVDGLTGLGRYGQG